MANVLSQDEVDSLLEGISDGAVQTEIDVPESDGEIKAYDFSMPAGPVHRKRTEHARNNRPDRLSPIPDRP